MPPYQPPGIFRTFPSEQHWFLYFVQRLIQHKINYWERIQLSSSDSRAETLETIIDYLNTVNNLLRPAAPTTDPNYFNFESDPRVCDVLDYISAKHFPAFGCTSYIHSFYQDIASDIRDNNQMDTDDDYLIDRDPPPSPPPNRHHRSHPGEHIPGEPLPRHTFRIRAPTLAPYRPTAYDLFGSSDEEAEAALDNLPLARRRTRRTHPGQPLIFN